MSVRFASQNIKLLATSSVLPSAAVNNDTLFDLLERKCGALVARKARLITRRLKINSRHFCHDFESDGGSESIANTTSIDFCCEAFELALNRSQLAQVNVGYLIGHTTSPATLLPPNIAWVADRLGFENPYMELRQACTGFANALQIAIPMLQDSNLDAIAVVGSEAGSMYFDLTSEFVDEQQLVNFVQMGDGAGAVVLAADDGSGRGIISDAYFGHIGIGQKPAFQLAGGGSLDPHCVNNFPAFKHDVTGVKERGKQLFIQGLTAILDRGFDLSDFAYFIPHQVNGGLARLMSVHLGVAEEKIVVDADTLGNMGSAAIWVSLDRLIHSGKLMAGDRVLVLGAEATKYMYGGFIYTH